MFTALQLWKAHADILTARLRAVDPRTRRPETVEVVIIAAGLILLALALVALLGGFFDRHKGPLEG